MTNYVGQIEDLIRMNPISRNKLTNEAVEMINKPAVDNTDHTTYSTMRIVIMTKL